MRTGLIRPRISGVCLRCGYCVQVCPAGAIRVKNRAFVINAADCIDCRACLEVCPAGAVVREAD